MKRGYFITGTDTGVGKTLVATALMQRFAQSGNRVVGMKPVAAGAELCDGQLLNEDVTQMLKAANVEAPLALVNPYVFEPPVAPHIAARQANVLISLNKIKGAFAALGELADVVVVEGAGGFLVPLNDKEDMADLAVVLGLPVILVVGMRLGCLNHALLTAAAIQSLGLELAGWVANCLDSRMAHLDENLLSLEQRLGAPCLGVVPVLDSKDFSRAAEFLKLPG